MVRQFSEYKYYKTSEKPYRRAGRIFASHHQDTINTRKKDREKRLIRREY